MMRFTIAEFLEVLRNVLRPPEAPSPPLPPVAPVRLPPSQTGEMRQQYHGFQVPDLSAVAERSPPVPPAVMAAYWREALDYLDFAALARPGQREVTPLHLYDVNEVARKAGLGATDTDSADAGPPGREVNVVLCLWELDRNGRVQAGRARHPLLNVPALMDESGLLSPRINRMPELNARYLAPDVQPGCFTLARQDVGDEMLMAAMSELAGDKTVSPGWAAWWQACRQVLNRLTGCQEDDLLATWLGTRANEVKASKKKILWGLRAAVYGVSGSGAKAVTQVYDNIVKTDADGPDGLFHRLCGAGGGEDIARLPSASHRKLYGHIDEYEGGARGLFPLDDTQRSAVRAILSLGRGQLQAVNGPPGSGKTAMLRAVVASKWVSAALTGQPCPIVVACGATNQSVTNVIEAFGKAPHPDDGVPHAQRWVDGAPSYGAFLPSSSFKSDAKNGADLNRIVCIEKVDNPGNAGFLYRYFQRTNILDPGHARSCEHTYLQRARHALEDASLHSIEEAVLATWRRLRAVAEAAEACHDAARNGGDWTEAGRAYLDMHGSYWTAKRRNVAQDLLMDEGGAGRMAAALKFIDLSWRAEAFHWAARYWEGRFLLAQRERLLSRHPLNVEEALRRLCMLTPCLVSTLHTVPQFAQIDSMATGQDEERSHVYGVIDLLVLDEAGQALPELAGAAFALAKSAAVVGDLKQLAPVASNTRLAEIGIATRAEALSQLDAIDRTGCSVVSGSALAMARRVSRWTEFDDDGVSLRFHYRCKPSIIEYCNVLCYDSKLRPQTKEDSPFPEPALGWVNIDAIPTLLGGSQCNRPEADALVEWIAERWPAWQAHSETAGKPLHDIVAIVTPYRAQADYLSGRLQAVFGERRVAAGFWPSSDEVSKVTIGTVHRLQGAERPIVCFSLVEGPEQASGSFVDRDKTLMNVAVSRAKSSFLIFANPQRLFPATADVEDAAFIKPVHLLGQHLKASPEARLLYPEKLVLIEAGGKLGTMSSILGKPSALVATGGALWNLPLATGVDIGAGLVPRPVLAEHAGKAIEQARKVLANVDELVFATDDDRMGEYIAWQARQLLGVDAAGKLVGRARLGAITPAQVTTAFASLSSLDEAKVLAEAVREVADCLLARRFAGLRPVGAPGPVGDLDLFRQAGICTEARVGRVQPVGRVQAAVLRMLLQRAQQVVEAADQFRIKATVALGARRYTGHAFILADGRELTTEQAAMRFVSKADGSPLDPLRPPEVYTEACVVPVPGTIDILARAWERYRMAPWTTMEVLQTLYDGSWSQARGSVSDIEEPIAPAVQGGGHPPLRPLDRSATPEQMRSVMSEQSHQVYSLIWDYFLASEQPALTVTSTSLTYRVTEHVGVKFDAVDCAGLPDDFLYIMFDREMRGTKAANRGVGRHRMQLAGLAPVYSAERALSWDIRPDQLLLHMAEAQVGRPSTYAVTLHNLVSRKLLQFPDDDGPLRLTPDGLATALALAQQEPALSAPGYSAQLLARIGQIESGQCGPKEVLLELLQQLVPDAPLAAIAPRVWNSLAQLEARMCEQSALPFGGPLVTRGDAGLCPTGGTLP